MLEKDEVKGGWKARLDKDGSKVRIPSENNMTTIGIEQQSSSQ